ncbi:MAG: GNAT family N-acetyltransferase, partial [Janthinobacterium lividum]
MTLEVRRLGPEDTGASQRLGWEAFGVPATPEPPEAEQPGWHGWGAYSGGRLVAQAADREYDGWFGGRMLPLAGVADVTVAAEARGAGVLGPLLRAMLQGARDRGAVMSTLFPTAPRIYRRVGYEAIGTLRWVDVPSAALGALPPAPAVVLRRAGPEDAGTVRQLYAGWASGLDGPLTRTGISFPETDAELVGAATGLTLAEDVDGQPLGYTAWVRGSGQAGAPDLLVRDLVAGDASVYAALLRMLGSFSSVAATVRLRTTGNDLLRLLLPTADWTPLRENLY